MEKTSTQYMLFSHTSLPCLVSEPFLPVLNLQMNPYMVIDCTLKCDKLLGSNQ